ncbi:hypothetical protein [Paenibacillus medicaginis]|uniref:N-acetyltransferase domain-containing protein n=1 Tax=Paenibacillus medicaginis TaxID=1470560 RepID=A0ABV5C9H4_9BACL
MLEYRKLREDDTALLEQFECDDEISVRSFLVEQAIKFQKLNLTNTRLYFNEQGDFVGYFSLYNDMMQIGKSKRRKHKLSSLPSYKYYPAVKLHYLGVDLRHRKKGYGEYLLLAALNLIIKTNRHFSSAFRPDYC